MLNANHEAGRVWSPLLGADAAGRFADRFVADLLDLAEAGA